MERKEIYTSKKKSVLLLIGSIVFVVLGIWFVIEADNLTEWRIKSPILIRGIGIVAILFFGLGIFAGIKRIIKSEIALIIAAEGISVNPKKSPVEFIKWEDVLGFEEIKIHSTKILIIQVKDPQYWLDKESNTFRKKIMQFNVNNYNSPFNIAANGLDISSKELNNTLNSYFEKYKN
ncbi:STM3941 family protein [Aquimarina gracilis]|uniref:STM3941 family protein n=1 Tax=Aquimarina gracilis TaxID=874422 RepID=A0ABU5ZWB2_9FLAO|nr:STM3941 family protein [Aquimarina gracilis]MEB3346143.1 STM3941 family protein [Aquimarina gracilis]